ALIAAIAVAIILPTLPLFVRAVFDKAIPQHDFGLVIKLMLAMLGLGVLKAIGHGVRRQKAGEISIGVEADLPEKLDNHVQALDVGYHERISTGQIMSRATSDINAIRQNLMSLGWSVTLVIQVVVMFVIMFAIAPKLAFVFAVTSPFLGWYT